MRSAWCSTRYRLPLKLALCMLLLASAVLPLVVVQAQQDERCFAETGQCISGRFREFWEQHGGQAVFGVPISPRRGEVVGGRLRQVQWFEYHRMELHPENFPPDDVLLSNLGSYYLHNEEKPPRDMPSGHFDCVYFETGFNVCGEVLALWHSYGLELDGRPGFSEIENRALFGAPLTGGYGFTFPSGHGYIVQWFERARFEVHPEGARMGRIGLELYTGTPPQPAPAPAVLPAPADAPPTPATPVITPTQQRTPTTP